MKNIILFIYSVIFSFTSFSQEKGTWKGFGYQPEGMNMWDPWFLVDGDTVHMFHLQRWVEGSARRKADQDYIGHAISTDLVNWREMPLVVGPNEKGKSGDMQPWTGGAIKHDGIFYLYYTMRSSKEDGRNQAIGLSTSSDGIHWKPYPGNPVITPDSRWYVNHENPEPGHKVGCRDLKVVRDPKGNGWIGLYAATVRAEEEAEAACIAAVRSDDLIHWEHLPPAFLPKRYGEVEAHDFYEFEGKWWMNSLTSYGHGNRAPFSDPYIIRGNIYAVANKPEGPYKENIKKNTLLGGDKTSAGTLATLLFKGKRYAIFNEGRGISPPMELSVTKDQQLQLVWSELQNIWRGASLIRGELPEPIDLRTHRTGGLTAGNWKLENSNGVYRGMSRTGWQVADLGIGKRNMEVDVKLTLKKGVAGGLALRFNKEQEHATGDFVFGLDATEQCAFVAELPFFQDNRRKFKVKTNQEYHLRLYVREDRYELFIDDVLILQGGFAPKMVERVNPSIGLFIDRGEAEIELIDIYKQVPLSIEY